MRAWADEVRRQTGVRIEPELCTAAQLRQRIRSRQADAFSLNILEFVAIAGFADRELVVEQNDLPDGQDYLLLVHQSSGIQNLADLRGRSLVLYRNRKMCLDRVWLETLLASAHLGPSETFLGRVENNTKLSRVVLPVFFRQADACLVTRGGYNTMCDLNPQLSKQLRPLAVSPKLLTTFLAYLKGGPLETKGRFLSAVTDLYKTAGGQQALTLFGGARLVPADVSVLRNSLDMMRAYERLKGKLPAAAQ
jgi:phosphonate transport system substrate-binding protein